MSKKLDAGQKHLLRLIDKGKKSLDGWCHVSSMIYPLLQNTMPTELVEHQPAENGTGLARLTEEGESLLRAMEWI